MRDFANISQKINHNLMCVLVGTGAGVASCVSDRERKGRRQCSECSLCRWLSLCSNRTIHVALSRWSQGVPWCSGSARGHCLSLTDDFQVCVCLCAGGCKCSVNSGHNHLQWSCHNTNCKVKNDSIHTVWRLCVCEFVNICPLSQTFLFRALNTPY